MSLSLFFHACAVEDDRRDAKRLGGWGGLNDCDRGMNDVTSRRAEVGESERERERGRNDDDDDERDDGDDGDDGEDCLLYTSPSPRDA